jgi:hypothetical protein
MPIMLQLRAGVYAPEAVFQALEKFRAIFSKPWKKRGARFQF